MRGIKRHFERVFAIGLFLLVSSFSNAEPLTLEKADILALQNNIEIKNAVNETKAAQELNRATVTKLFPSISATGAGFNADDYILKLGPMGLIEKFNLQTITATQPVFAGGRIFNANRLTSIGANAARIKQEKTLYDILEQTSTKYWQLVSLVQKAATLDAYQKMLDSLNSQVAAAYQGGLVLRNDQMKVQVKRDEIEIRRSQLANGRALALMDFCLFLGIPYDSSITVTEPQQSDMFSDEIYIDPQKGLHNRKEYTLLEQSDKAERLLTELKVGEYLPQAAIGVGRIFTKIDKASGQYDNMVFGTVSVPISGLWEGYHSYQERRQKEIVAIRSNEHTRDLLMLQQNQAWRDIGDAKKEIELCRLALQQANLNLDLNKQSYENGLVNLSDLLEAQATYQQAQDRLTDANAGYSQKRLHYLIVTGQYNRLIINSSNSKDR